MDTILAELRTSDKDPVLAFGKKFVLTKGQTAFKGTKRKRKAEEGRGNKCFHKEQQSQGGNSPQGNGGAKSHNTKRRAKRRGQDKSANPQPSTSGQ